MMSGKPFQKLSKVSELYSFCMQENDLYIPVALSGPAVIIYSNYRDLGQRDILLSNM